MPDDGGWKQDMETMLLKTWEDAEAASQSSREPSVVLFIPKESDLWTPRQCKDPEQGVPEFPAQQRCPGQAVCNEWSPLPVREKQGVRTPYLLRFAFQMK